MAEDRADIRRNAEHIVGMLERRGLQARLLDGAGGPPVVYGELKTAGARSTVVVYAHYDGQPVDPSQWTGAPFAPVLRDKPLEAGGHDVALDGLSGPVDPEWRLYGRSTSDDKAPVLALAAALDALRAAGAKPAVNLKVFFEGEEERGSPHLRQVLERNADLLRSDLWLLCDGPVHQTRRPQLYFGARGTVDLELTLYGAARALHSGHYGNWAPNPAAVLADLLASMRDPDGRILIQGFYDDVRPTTEAERAALAAVPAVDAALRDELALAASEANDALLVERLMLPALNVRGILAGHVGAQASNAIPTEAQASIDFRLVPNQAPERVRQRVEAHLRSRGFTIAHERPDPALRRKTPRLAFLQWSAGYPAARTPLDAPASRAVIGAIESWLGAPIVKMPTLGGSIPMYLFQEALGAPVIGLPIANHDNNQHAANENIRIQNLWDGVELYAALLTGLQLPPGR
jgi:acetylornithine deacetylase/succinyl-diaminopimelate desuccinylase-like protein